VKDDAYIDARYESEEEAVVFEVPETSGRMSGSAASGGAAPGPDPAGEAPPERLFIAPFPPYVELAPGGRVVPPSSAAPGHDLRARDR
jgi:hypothetical protein